MNWLRKNITAVLLVLVIAIGFLLILYPTLSDWRNSRRQSRAIASYSQNVSDTGNVRNAKILEVAREYNEKLAKQPMNWQLSDAELAEYTSQMNISGDGILCYVEIPKINCSLPVFHGTEDSVLETAIGHIPGSSLPAGGESTHAVLSGHRGLPSAKLFTNLDKLVPGDTFQIHVMDEILMYEVDQILVVEPTDVSQLGIEEGKDLVTLVTCTPYGINSHRLLVRGSRITFGAQKEDIHVRGDAVRIGAMEAVPIAAAPTLLFLLLFFLKPKKGSEQS